MAGPLQELSVYQWLSISNLCNGVGLYNEAKGPSGNEEGSATMYIQFVTRYFVDNSNIYYE